MSNDRTDPAGREPVCRIRDFSLSFPHHGAFYPAVKGLNLVIYPGEMVALIGESGCGKSVTALSMIGLQSEEARLSGEIIFQGKDIRKLKEKEWQDLRGSRISMVFQEPMTALNPLIQVGRQIAENVTAHRKVSRQEAEKTALEIMKLVGLPDAEAMYHEYPHQLSGGQRQRIMIAMAFVNDPDLLIADEPTTALDVTIQAQIMQLMKRLNREKGSAVLLITHNLGLVRSLCSRVYIMYAGHVVEEGKVQEILDRPMHPYTIGLAAAIPGAAKRGSRLDPIPGTVPAIYQRPAKGCAFASRCACRMDVCGQEDPPCREFGERRVYCHGKGENIVDAGIDGAF